MDLDEEKERREEIDFRRTGEWEKKKKRVRERDQNSDTKAINNNEPPQRDRLYPGI